MIADVVWIVVVEVAALQVVGGGVLPVWDGAEPQHHEPPHVIIMNMS